MFQQKSEEIFIISFQLIIWAQLRPWPVAMSNFLIGVL